MECKSSIRALMLTRQGRLVLIGYALHLSNPNFMDVVPCATHEGDDLCPTHTYVLYFMPDEVCMLVFKAAYQGPIFGTAKQHSEEKF